MVWLSGKTNYRMILYIYSSPFFEKNKKKVEETSNSCINICFYKQRKAEYTPNNIITIREVEFGRMGEITSLLISNDLNCYGKNKRN